LLIFTLRALKTPCILYLITMAERLTVEQSMRLYADYATQETMVKSMFGKIEKLFMRNDIRIDRENSRYFIEHQENMTGHYSLTPTIGTTRYILSEDSYIPQAQQLVERNFKTPAAFYFSSPSSFDHIFSLPIANYPSQGYAQVMQSNSHEPINTPSLDEAIYARLYATHILVNPHHIIELQITSIQEWEKIQLFQLIQEQDEKKLFNPVSLHNILY